MLIPIQFLKHVWSVIFSQFSSSTLIVSEYVQIMFASVSVIFLGFILVFCHKASFEFKLIYIFTFDWIRIYIQ